MPKRHERDLRRLARAHGWHLERRKGAQHWRLKHPDGPVVTVSSSPSDRGNMRVVQGAMARIERGLQVPQQETTSMWKTSDQALANLRAVFAETNRRQEELENLSPEERARHDLEGSYYDCLAVGDTYGAGLIKRRLELQTM